jgi:hypothetical protein
MSAGPSQAFASLNLFVVLHMPLATTFATPAGSSGFQKRNIFIHFCDPQGRGG